MKRQPRILASTALGLLMASAPFGAFPLMQARAAPLEAEIILAQAECPEGEDCAEQAAPEAEQQPRRERRQKQQEEAAPEAAPEAQGGEQEQQPRRERKQRQQEQQQEEATPGAEGGEQPEQPRRERQQRRQQQQSDGAGQAEQPAPEAEQQQEQPRREQQPEAQPEQGQAEPQTEPQAEPEQKPRRGERQRRNQQPAETQEQVTPEAPTVAPTPEVKPDAPAPETAPVPEAAPAQPPETAPGGTAPANDNAAPADQSGGNTGQAPAAEGAPAQTEAPVVDPNAGPDAAPVLDSQKEEPAETRRGGRNQRGQDGQRGDGQRPERPAAVDQGPPPESDRAATEAAQPQRVEPVREERGRRVDSRPDDDDFRRRERPDGLDVLKSIGDRVIIRFGDQVSVESNDRPRMTRGAQEVYYEDLPRGRTRETIVRENGNQVVTIRNEYGEVIRRSRITPDGREYVLSYVDEQNYDRVRDRRDPGYDLPPMRLNVPIDEYILNSDRVEDPEEYYDFLDQPPVERVERLYSIDEVKRSARVRDIARRVDLDTLTFDFGSADVPESQVEKLEGVASAMEKLLEKNPAETFLIEGHTDAVGSDEANLALSDRRAEAVAQALTNVFAIPPENLATQGYGERYLKVKTTKPEQENRRVGIRRITPLVAPVASAN